MLTELNENQLSDIYKITYKTISKLDLLENFSLDEFILNVYNRVEKIAGNEKAIQYGQIIPTMVLLCLKNNENIKQKLNNSKFNFNYLQNLNNRFNDLQNVKKFFEDIKKGICYNLFDEKKLNEFSNSVNIELKKNNINFIFSSNKINYIANHLDEYYSVFKILKKSGKFRHIHSPNNELKLLQKIIKKDLESFFTSNPFSHGFIKKRNIITNAKIHVNMNYILNIDILNFFHSISTETVYESLIEIGIDNHIALIYSKICTLKNKLPQGSPTSPILSNIVCKKLDKILSEFSYKHNLNYTRYADDITFSGDKNIYNLDFISNLKFMLKEFNFNLNYEKTRILDKTKRQDVTGIVVNEKINVSRKYIRELRAMIHNFSKKPSKHTHLIHIIRGKLSYLKMVRGNDHIYNNLNNKFLRSIGFEKKSQNSLSNKFITSEKITSTKYQNIGNEVDKKVFKKKYLFFDTETTGLPKIFSAPISKSENWPRLVQLAYIIYDASGNKLKSINYIIKPVGYDIPIESSNIHGISNNYALANGFLIKDVLKEFLNDLNDISLIIAHNMSYDKKIIESELYRNGFNFNFNEEKLFCTMTSSVDFCKIKNQFGYFKWPKLEELHFKLFKENFENAHDAFTDVKITAKCFWELKKLGVIKKT